MWRSSFIAMSGTRWLKFNCKNMCNVVNKVLYKTHCGSFICLKRFYYYSGQFLVPLHCFYTWWVMDSVEWEINYSQQLPCNLKISISHRKSLNYHHCFVSDDRTRTTCYSSYLKKKIATGIVSVHPKLLSVIQLKCQRKVH